MEPMLTPPQVMERLKCTRREVSGLMRMAGAVNLSGSRGPVANLRLQQERLDAFLLSDLRDLRVTPAVLASRLDWRQRAMRWEFVYFIECAKFIKIGYAGDPQKRLETLQICNPHKLRLLAVFSGGKWLEVALHARFNHHRERGEWFRKCDEILSLTGWWQ